MAIQVAEQFNGELLAEAQCCVHLAECCVGVFDQGENLKRFKAKGLEKIGLSSRTASAWTQLRRINLKEVRVRHSPTCDYWLGSIDGIKALNLFAGTKASRQQSQ
jgi:hypothetical protein